MGIYRTNLELEIGQIRSACENRPIPILTSAISVTDFPDLQFLRDFIEIPSSQIIVIEYT